MAPTDYRGPPMDFLDIALAVILGLVCCNIAILLVVSHRLNQQHRARPKHVAVGEREGLIDKEADTAHFQL